MSTRFPKDYDQIIINIDGVDVSGIVGQTEIYQDIFAPVWSCTVVFLDTQNQLMNLPIKPGSEIEIILETSAPKPCQGKVTFNFVAFKISDRELIKQETYTYMVHGISKEYFDDQRKRVSKYYNGTADSIAKKIISDSGIGKITDASVDSNKYDVIIPNLSPFTAIEWLTTFTKTPNAGADFCFYQLADDKFAFNSIEDMFNDKSDFKLKQLAPDVKINSEEKEDSYISIQQYQIISQIDALPNFEMGFFGSKTVSHDIINKKFTESEYKYGDDLAVDKTFAPFSGDVFDDAGNANISFVPLHGEVAEKAIVPNETHKNWKGSRKASVMKLETNRLIVDIPGHACLYDQLGRTIEVELPSHQDVTLEKHDEYMKGDYLVTAIRHIIGKEYTIFMELSKKRMSKKY
jgi:hypothetical protein